MEDTENNDIKQNNLDIISKIQKCTCSILNSNSSGFFCKFPFFGQSKYLNVLIVNYDSINYDTDDDFPNITVILNNTNNDDLPNREIILDGSRFICKYKQLNITLIEILEEDNISDFLELDFNNNIGEKYLKSIELEQFLFSVESKDGIDLRVFYGLFSENDKLIYIPPKTNNDNNYKGLPTLSPNNFKVIGIHCGYSQSSEFAKGSFIKFLNENINKKCEKDKETIKKKNNEINNEITIKYKIDDDDKIKIFDKDFVLKTKEDFKIIIEGKEQEICSELDITENIKNKKFLEIKLKQYNLANDISNMF